MPKISIIIPVFNHADELKACLESLKRQSFKDFEVIIVDDGSEQNLESRISNLESTLDKKIALIRFDKNKGAPAARNAGFEKSSGEYVMFLDADAVLEPDALEVMVNILNADQGMDFVYAPVRWGVVTIGGGPFDPERLKQVNYIHTSALIRRQAFPGFDESLKKFQDWDLFLTMSGRGSRGAAVKRPLYSITERKTGMSRWVPKITYVFPWHLIDWKPKAVRVFDEADAVIRKKHGLRPDPIRRLQGGMVEIMIWALAIAGLQLLSALTVFKADINSAAALAVGFTAFVLSLRAPSTGLAMMATELIIGSKGRLLVFGADEVNNGGVHLRMILFAAFFAGWGLRSIINGSWKQWNGLFAERIPYLVLAGVLFLAFVNGWRQGHDALFSDANAWGFLLLLIPVLDLASRQGQKLSRIIGPALFAAFGWLIWESAILFYFFSHEFGAMRDPAYLWIRRTGIGEITRLAEGFSTSRVFLQSHIYPALAFVGLFAFGARAKKDAALIIASALLMIPILVSLSRSIWIGMAFGCLIGFAFLLRMKIASSALRKTAAGTIAGLFMVLGLMYFPWPASRPVSLAQLLMARADTSEAAALSRWQMLPPLVEKIRQAPIFGHGFGATVTYTSSDPRIVAKTGGSYTTHAFEWGWLDLWIKFGLIGLMALGWLYVSLIKRLWAKLDRRTAGAWVAVLVALAAVHVFTPYLNHPLGLAVILAAEAMTAPKKEPASVG